MPRAKKEPPPPPLHELEEEVMEEMWDRESATVREVLEALNRRGPKQRAYTTIMTIMVRLDRKGLLTRERKGKTDVYSTVMSREAYRDARAEADVKAIVDEYGELALVHFSERIAELDPKRVRALRRLAKS